ncbi:T9SS type A sorting domain-containing protein [Marivirga lumbricoides]
MSSLALSQDFAVENLKKSLSVAHQKEVTSAFYIKNFTNTTKSFQVSINRNLLQSGSTVRICQGGICYDESFRIAVSPESTSKEIQIQFIGGLSSFKSSLIIEVKDLEKSSIFTQEIYAEVTSQKNDDILYQKDDIKISNFYPNPAIEAASLEYSINSNERNAKIILQNVLGSIVEEYPLDPRENKLRLLTEKMSPGIYFYTLFIRDEGLATRKLIVKK